MPYGKRTHKKTTYRRKPTLKRTVARNRKAIRRIQSSIETKAADYGLPLHNVEWTIDWQCVNLIAQGLTSVSRIGDRIRATSIDIKIVGTWNTLATGGTQQNIMCYVVVDKRPAQGLPDANTFLPTSGGTIGLRVWEDRTRYHTLKIIKMALQPDAVAEVVRSAHIKIPAKYQQLKYRGPTSTIADIEAPTILVGFISNEGTLANGPLVEGQLRLKYQDA